MRQFSALSLKANLRPAKNCHFLTMMIAVTSLYIAEQCSRFRISRSRHDTKLRPFWCSISRNGTLKMPLNHHGCVPLIACRNRTFRSGRFGLGTFRSILSGKQGIHLAQNANQPIALWRDFLLVGGGSSLSCFHHSGSSFMTPDPTWQPKMLTTASDKTTFVFLWRPFSFF